MTTSPESKWLEETSRLLRKRTSDIRLKTISEDCKVSVAWLSKLQTGKLLTAPVEKVERVNVWLKAHKDV